MHRRLAALLPLLLCCTSAAARAQAPTAASLARTVDAHYNHLHSLQAHFVERYQGMGMDRSEAGTLTLEKPGRMRWAYDTPPGKVFLLDGKYAISYTPGDAQATRFSEKQLDDLRSPLRFLLGHTELAKELNGLTLTLVNGEFGGYSLSGTPKRAVGRLRSLALTVDRTGVIHRLRAEETDGSVTTFTFSNMSENLPTPASDFTFTPPAGVVIVNGEAPM